MHFASSSIVLLLSQRSCSLLFSLKKARNHRLESHKRGGRLVFWDRKTNDLQLHQSNALFITLTYCSSPKLYSFWDHWTLYECILSQTKQKKTAKNNFLRIFFFRENQITCLVLFAIYHIEF